MEEIAITCVAVTFLAVAGLVVVVKPSLSFWQNDES